MTPSDIYRQLVAVFDDWGGFLKDPQYVRINDEITWNEASVTLQPEVLTREDTIDLSRRGQYTFRISEDDSLVQISYRFLHTGELQGARLAYYEVGRSLGDEELEVRPWDERDELTSVVKWVRFDYGCTGLGRVLHMDSHLHVSGLPGIRFAVTGVPTPKQFIEFLISHFYPVKYQEARLTPGQQFEQFTTIDNINAAFLSPLHDLRDVYRRISHFRIPGGDTSNVVT